MEKTAALTTDEARCSRRAGKSKRGAAKVQRLGY